MMTNSEHHEYDTMQELLFENGSTALGPETTVSGDARRPGVGIVVVVVVDPAVHPGSTPDVVPGIYSR